MKNQKRKYIIMGILIPLILAASYWGFNFLKGNDLFSDQHNYHIVYESIEGLTVSNAVTMNGFEIGKVSNIEMMSGEKRKIVVTITTEEKYQVPDSSVASIYSVDLMGTKGIKIINSSKQKMHSEGDTLLGQTEQSLKEQVSMQMLPVKNQAEDLMKEMKTVVKIIRYIFNEETQANLQKSFQSIQYTVENLESSSSNLDSMMKKEKDRISSILKNIDNISGTLNSNKENIENAITNLSDVSDSLKKVDIKKTVDNLNTTAKDLAKVTDKINNGEGSLGLLINNDSLYNQLERASTNLDRLVWDIRANPERYINLKLIDFGKTLQIVDEDMLNKREKKRLKEKREKLDKKNKE